MASLSCPRCQTPLQEAKLEESTVHPCPNCEGTWYPEEALSSVTDRSLSELSGSVLQPSLVGDKLETVDLEKPISCPVCAAPMMRYRYTMTCDVVLDECLDHGIWLDDGELGSLMTFLEDLYKGVEDTRDRLASGVTETNLEYLEEELSREEPGVEISPSRVLEALYQVHSRPR